VSPRANDLCGFQAPNQDSAVSTDSAYWVIRATELDGAGCSQSLKVESRSGPACCAGRRLPAHLRRCVRIRAGGSSSRLMSGAIWRCAGRRYLTSHDLGRRHAASANTPVITAIAVGRSQLIGSATGSPCATGLARGLRGDLAGDGAPDRRTRRRRGTSAWRCWPWPTRARATAGPVAGARGPQTRFPMSGYPVSGYAVRSRRTCPVLEMITTGGVPRRRPAWSGSRRRGHHLALASARARYRLIARLPGDALIPGKAYPGQ
jgi:hypothetical protein